jgi:predicted Zn-dependent protease
MNRFFLLLSAFSLGLLAGCADMKNMPGGVSAITGMIPGASKLAPYADTGAAALQAGSEAMRDIPEDEEIAIGERLMQGILGAAPLYNDDRIQRYVNRVGRWVANHSERPNLPWHFAVLNSPIANAGAAPGGQVYITTGLLFRMRSEAELAGALGHEVAHVVQKHHLKLYQRQKKGEAGKALGGAILEQNVKVGGGALGQAAKGAVIDFGLDVLKGFILSPLDRSEEEQADRMGMVLAARSGYDPFGLPTVIQTLQEVLGAQGDVSVLFATHPTPSDRLASLDRTIGKSLDQYASQPVLQDRFVREILGSVPPVEKKEAVTPAKPAAKTPTKPPA